MVKDNLVWRGFQTLDSSLPLVLAEEYLPLGAKLENLPFQVLEMPGEKTIFVNEMFVLLMLC